jgi:O-antigen/teichoic acid export membrane protein
VSDGTTRRAAVVYVGLAMAQRAIGFVLVPFTSSALTATEYGKISILSSFVVLMSTFLSLGLETFTFRNFARNADDRDQAGLGATAWYLRGVLPVAGATAAAAFFLVPELWGIDGWAIAAALLASFFAPATFAYALPRLRASDRLRPFFFLTGSAVLLQSGLTLILVVVADQGIRGWAVATAVPAVVSLFASYLIRAPSSPERRIAALVAPVVFAAPLLPHQLFIWVIGFADRALIAGILGGAQAGAYSVAYQMASVLGLLLTETNRAFMPRYARASHTSAQAEVRKLAVTQLVLMVALTSTAVLCSPVLSIFLFDGEYSVGAELVVALLVAHLPYGLYFIPTNVLTLTHGRTRRMWLASGSGAVVNIGLNVALLPLVGIWGAVWATLVAYLTMAIVAAALEKSSGGLLTSGIPRWGIALATMWALVFAATALPTSHRVWMAWLTIGAAAVITAIVAQSHSHAPRHSGTRKVKRN